MPDRASSRATNRGGLTLVRVAISLARPQGIPGIRLQVRAGIPADEEEVIGRTVDAEVLPVQVAIGLVDASRDGLE